MQKRDFFEFFTIQRFETPSPNWSCKACLESVGPCDQPATQMGGIRYVGTQVIDTIPLCDRHEQFLRDARGLLGFVSDMHASQEQIIEERKRRKVEVEGWARLFIERSASPDSLEPAYLAQRAYEFAHAMIGRKERYDSLVDARPEAEIPSDGWPGMGRTYYHDEDLLEKAAKDGLW